ncbi:hypothetical protein BKA93DRAFT_776649 [Sparassis latifolia]
MLPFPVSLSGRHQYPRQKSRSHRSTKDVLLTQSRVTNLGLLLLASLTAISLLFNLRFYFSASRNPLPYQFVPTANSILSTIQRDRAVSVLDHLIIVPGHAVWKGTNAERKLDDDEWILEPYQRGGGPVSAFYKHITTGAELARQDENSLLIFSGGQTRRTSTTTEGESYMRLALTSGFLPISQPYSADAPRVVRATTEGHALDSFQNLLFSIARFHQYTGHYPEQITVVGFEMKRKRFMELHRAALRWPRDRFHYIGIDVEGNEAVKAHEGERLNGYLPYTLDNYGCHDFLLSKRRQRNPFARYHSYYTSSPELGPLLDWCPGPSEGGQTVIYTGPLPWDNLR